MLIFGYILFLIYILSSILFDTYRSVVSKELLVSSILFLGLFTIYFKAKIFKDWKNFLFICSSVLLIVYCTSNGMIHLPESFVVKQKMYIRFIFYFSLSLLFFLYYKYKSPTITYILTILSATNILLSWYYLTNQVRAIPLLLYSIVFLIDWISNNKVSLLKKNYVFYSISALIISSVLSTLFAINFWNSFSGLVYVFSGYLVFLFVSTLKKTKERYTIIQLLSIFSGLSIFIFFIYILSFDKLKIFGLIFETSIGSFQVNSIGSMIALNFPMFLFLSFYTKKGRVYYILLILISLVILYYTHSRASILGITISSIFISFLHFKKKKHIKLNPKIIFFLGSAFVAFLLLIFINSKFNEQLLNFHSVQTRFSIWKYFTLVTFQNSPVLGFGLDNEYLTSSFNWKVLSEAEQSYIQQYIVFSRSNPHAHNLIIQIFNNLGILGILSLFFIFIGIAYKIVILILKNKRNSIFSLLPISVLVSVFFQELFDYTIPDSVLYYELMIFLGLLNSTIGKRELENKNSKALTGKLTYQKLVIIPSLSTIFVFFSAITYNYKLNDYITYSLFKHKAYLDNFNNFKLLIPIELDANLVNSFMKLDKYYLPIAMEEKREIFTGNIYFELYNKKLIQSIELPIERFNRCLQTNNRSSICYNQLSILYGIKGELKKKEEHLQKSIEYDPLRLIQR